MKKKAIDHSKFPFLNFIGVLVVSGLVSACLGENVCGKKLVEYEEMCIMPSTTDTQTDGSDSSDTGALGDAGESDSETGEPPLPTGMDDPCTSSDECAGEADFCLPIKYPDPNGVCTTQGCDVELNDCPSGYSCYDLSEYIASLPTVCVDDSVTSKRMERTETKGGVQ
jgi:hypothetical protein